PYLAKESSFEGAAFCAQLVAASPAMSGSSANILNLCVGFMFFCFFDCLVRSEIDPVSMKGSFNSVLLMKCLFRTSWRCSTRMTRLGNILGQILVEAMNIDRQEPRNIGQTELAAYGMDLIERVGRGAARIVGDLPRVVPGRTDFEQQAHVFPKRQKLANTPVKREVVARR